MNIATNILTAVLIFISIFTFVILGAGSHGQMGLWDHGDSFSLYIFIFYGFVLIAGLRFLNYRRNGGSKSKRNIIIGLNAPLFVIGTSMINSTYHEDLTSAPERVLMLDYFKIIIPMLIMMYWIYKLLMMNETHPNKTYE